MFNECLIHLFEYTCLNVMCVCSTIYGSIQKDFWSFYIFLEVIFSLFVFMFSAYFVFHCLNMFFVEKQVSEFFATQLATRQLRVHPEAFTTHSQLVKIFATCLVAKCSETVFWRAFHGKLVFKPLPSSLKPFFQYFYIKTQSIWMIFHSINISKVIINSFH